MGFHAKCKSEVSQMVNPLASDLRDSKIIPAFRCFLYVNLKRGLFGFFFFLWPSFFPEVVCA